MIPIKVSPSKIKVKNKEGTFEEIAIGAVNFGTNVNINDNAEGANSTWSSNKLKSEIESVVLQMQESSAKLNQKIEDSKNFTLKVVSTNGRYCDSDEFTTTLSVELYYGNELVTDQYEDKCFIWIRESLDKDGDIGWNATHNNGSKTLEITQYDLVSFSDTDFICQFWDSENEVLLASSI